MQEQLFVDKNSKICT